VGLDYVFEMKEEILNKLGTNSFKMVMAQQTVLTFVKHINFVYWPKVFFSHTYNTWFLTITCYFKDWFYVCTM